jgi:hypothetical protein
MKLAITAALLLAACGSDSDAPSASVKTATPEQLTPADDALNDLTITVRYDDPDGDLGGGVARVHDCRGDGLVTELPLPEIAPKSVVDDDRHITGELVLHVNDIGAFAPAAMPKLCSELGVEALASDRAVFCVELVDAADHAGDADCTAPVALDLL